MKDNYEYQDILHFRRIDFQTADLCFISSFFWVASFALSNVNNDAPFFCLASCPPIHSSLNPRLREIRYQVLSTVDWFCYIDARFYKRRIIMCIKISRTRGTESGLSVIKSELYFFQESSL
jgi:hypothetical protein